MQHHPMFNRYMPADSVQVVSLDQCTPAAGDPGKGFLFSEPLAREAQIYGEILLGFGPEITRGKIAGLTATAAAGGGGT